MSVKPWEMDHKGGAGIYYHADYVGHPRDYRWMNTNSYAKSTFVDLQSALINSVGTVERGLLIQHYRDLDSQCWIDEILRGTN